jgi:hypothetical protein
MAIAWRMAMYRCYKQYLIPEQAAKIDKVIKVHPTVSSQYLQKTKMVVTLKW